MQPNPHDEHIIENQLGKKKYFTTTTHWHLKCSFIRPARAGGVNTRWDPAATHWSKCGVILLELPHWLETHGPHIISSCAFIMLCVLRSCDNATTRSNKRAFPGQKYQLYLGRNACQGQGQRCQGYRKHHVALLTRFRLIIILCGAHSSSLGRQWSGNEIMNARCSAEQHWHCPSQEIKMLHLNCSFGVTFLVLHARLHFDLDLSMHTTTYYTIY